MRLSFTQKVFAAILGLILLLLSGVLFFFDLRTRNIAEKEMTRRLRQTDYAFQRYLEDRREKLRTVNAYISGNAYYIAYMAEAIDNGDTASLIDQFSEIQGFSKCDFMVVLDADGNPIVDSTQKFAAGAREQLIALRDQLDQKLGFVYEDEVGSESDFDQDVASAMDSSAEGGEDENAVIGIVQSMDSLYNVVISPIFSGEYLNGYVLVGYEIDNEDAEKIGNIANCDLIIISGSNQLVAGYFEESESDLSDEDWGQSLPKTTQGEIFDFSFKGEPYKGLIGELKSIGGSAPSRYATIKSLRLETRPFRNIRSQVMAIGGLAILIIMPLTVLAARRVTRPINHLVKAIGKVHDGDYDENNIKVESRDEIGIMAEAFRNMVRELREQRDLIEFLEAPISEKTTLDPDQTIPLSEEKHRVSLPPSSVSHHELEKAMKSEDHLPRGFVLAGRYKILNVIGRGGMGVVYRARDRSLEEIVAIKMLHLNRSDFAPMLKRETKLARKVTHRNILRIFDLGELGDVQFISMEFVKGTTLKQLLHKVKRLPVPIGQRIIGQICLGLAAAHQASVIHGDIKPENVIISKRGEVKVMDFGVSRLANVASAEGGMVSGTPAYMPPEQFQGKLLDGRSDIYSLGIMMYELFTGVLPFTGSLNVLFTQHLNTPIPSLHQRSAVFPLKLDHIVQKATMKKPEDRYSSTQELLADLKTL